MFLMTTWKITFHFVLSREPSLPTHGFSHPNPYLCRAGHMMPPSCCSPGELEGVEGGSGVIIGRGLRELMWGKWLCGRRSVWLMGRWHSNCFAQDCIRTISKEYQSNWCDIWCKLQLTIHSSYLPQNDDDTMVKPNTGGEEQDLNSWTATRPDGSDYPCFGPWWTLDMHRQR